jgi:drug/metabolite transporter (DMT)-like permease
MLFLFVIERWTASATSYVLLLMPLVTLAAAAVLLGEEVTPLALVGGLLVLLGVYVGTFSGQISKRLPAVFHRSRTPQTVELEINPCP